MLTRLPGRFWSNSMMHWFTYRPNLRNRDTKRFFDAVTNQFYASVRCFRLAPTVLPAPFADEELRCVSTPTLLVIGQQEALYDPVPAIERAERLLPNIETQLIAQAGHELPASKPETIDPRILGFLRQPAMSN
jgi:pimeloyl-ACP methyl ester carboxylesterase